MRSLQRPFWTPEQIAEIYAEPHDTAAHGNGHRDRIEMMVSIGRSVEVDPRFIADLSCGTAEVAQAIARASSAWPNVHVVLGDIAPGFPIHGPIERTILEIDPVDIFVCGETLEHLEDPDTVLAGIRAKARWLVATVPISERPEDDANGQHYWAFDQAGAEEMFRSAGWEPIIYEQVTAAPGTTAPTYQCGVWGLR